MNEYCFNDHIVKKLINKYGGSERKETIVLDDGYEYLLKLPDPTREKKRMLSYINNSISEYIGCKIMEKLKLSVQKVILGEYTTISSTGEKQQRNCIKIILISLNRCQRYQLIKQYLL